MGVFGPRPLPVEQGTVLCVDPGLRLCGVALFDSRGTLVRAGLVTSKLPSKTHIRGAQAWKASADEVRAWVGGCPLAKVIVEEQRIDGRTPNADDMLQVNGVAGACTELFPGAPVQGYWPETWKGSLPKADCTARIIDRINEDPVEGARVERTGVQESLQHNIYDAVGLGLFHWNRLLPRRIIHR